ncbi:hypothetical protein HY379_02365, partial [Candidatus Saccharibacteria bacterium]|nr:hypothetical protein [Candidatus Saccharibacteria bacterium]
AKFEDEYWLCINPEEVIDAILDAMTEPSDEVCEAGWGEATFTYGRFAPAAIFKDMIAAIKAGK